ncbi:unnamed protein product [Toxocara canis]|uniref:G protein-coupled receptor n=1 Tax=Toxocara canis TaxID=6265 RepID=A0A183UDN2_TOXCA|nr:unnamed protein product [Toxocara canis]
MAFYSHVYLALSFGYRYYILKRKALSAKELLTICLLTYSIAFAQLLIALASGTDSNYLRNYAETHKPEYDWSGAIIFGGDSSKNVFVFIISFTVVFPIFPIYTTIIIIRRKALTLQAAVPVICIFPPIFVYAFGHMGVLRTPVVEYLIFALSSVTPSVDALLTLYCVRPYREVIRSFLCRRQCGSNVSLMNKSSTFSVHDKSNELQYRSNNAANMHHNRQLPSIKSGCNGSSRTIIMVQPPSRGRFSNEFGPFKPVPNKVKPSPVEVQDVASQKRITIRFPQ